jgi:hypothetical protein
MQFYFPANSNYRVISNAHAEITSWEKNTPPITPVFNYPFNGAITYNTKPKISMTGTDVDGDKLIYQYSTDGSNWYNLATDVSSGTPIAG